MLIILGSMGFLVILSVFGVVFWTLHRPPSPNAPLDIHTQPSIIYVSGA